MQAAAKFEARFPIPCFIYVYLSTSIYMPGGTARHSARTELNYTSVIGKKVCFVSFLTMGFFFRLCFSISISMSLVLELLWFS